MGENLYQVGMGLMGGGRWSTKVKLNPRHLNDALNTDYISATTKAPDARARWHSPLARGDFAVPPDAYRDSASYPDSIARRIAC